MTTQKTVPQIVTDFIETVWNQQRFDQLDQFLHPNFTDYSLPPTLPSDSAGMMQWIQATSRAFEHQTLIDEQVTEGNKTMLKVRMRLKHIGDWRGMAATGAEVVAVGYRFYRLEDQKIVEHWGLIDGNAIENQLLQTAKGCKIAV